ncbi:hypothetical protein D9M71_628590 [compost metagenome]
MEHGLFPVCLAGDHVQVVDAYQFVLGQVVEQLRAAIEQLCQWQVDSGLAALLEAVGGGLQQVGTANTLLAPQVDKALGPAGVGFA